MPVPQSKWTCWDCDRKMPDEQTAIAHCEEHDHWIGEHPGGWRGWPATRTMNASDWGGVYVSDYPPGLAERMAREYRDRQAAQVF